MNFLFFPHIFVLAKKQKEEKKLKVGNDTEESSLPQ